MSLLRVVAFEDSCQGYMAPPAYSRNPRKGAQTLTRGLGSNLVSLVPCLGDALGVVGVKKKNF